MSWCPKASSELTSIAIEHYYIRSLYCYNNTVLTPIQLAIEIPIRIRKFYDFCSIAQEYVYEREGEDYNNLAQYH